MKYLEENNLIYLGTTGNALTSDNNVLGFFFTRDNNGETRSIGKDIDKLKPSDLRSGYYSIEENGKVQTYAFYPSEHGDQAVNELKKLINNKNVKSISLGAMGSLTDSSKKGTNRMRRSLKDLETFDINARTYGAGEDCTQSCLDNMGTPAFYMVFDKNNKLLGTVDSGKFVISGQNTISNVQKAFPEYAPEDLYIQQYDANGFDITHINGADKEFNVDGEYNDLFSITGSQVLVRRGKPEEVKAINAEIGFDFPQMAKKLLESRRRDLKNDLENKDKVLQRYGETKGKVILKLVELGLTDELIDLKLKEEFPEEEFQKHLETTWHGTGFKAIKELWRDFSELKQSSYSDALENEKDKGWQNISPDFEDTYEQRYQDYINGKVDFMTYTPIKAITDKDNNLKIDKNVVTALRLYLVRHSHSNRNYLSLANRLEKSAKRQRHGDVQIHKSHSLFRRDLIKILKSEGFQREYSKILYEVPWNGYIKRKGFYVDATDNNKYKLSKEVLSKSRDGKYSIKRSSAVPLASMLVNGLGADWFDQNSTNDTRARELLEKILQGKDLSDRDMRQIAHAIHGDKGFRSVP
ncbi:MAG: hypothetical protein MK033_12925 [Candidatus Caenarcaniphilales bacterium]|nr:hypothetical protein [Candidatus Caenarcaniphilales bacterium]